MSKESTALALQRIQAYIGAGEYQSHLLGTGAVAALEYRLRKYFGFRYAILLCNATSALLATQIALGLEQSEIITSPFCYGASFAGALHLRNHLNFADVDASLNLDPEAVRAALTPRTRAILTLDFNGFPSNMTALRKVANEHRLLLIADAAQSAGALLDGAPAIRGADAAVLSFTTGKTVATGEGGAVLTDRRDLYERIVCLTQHPLRQKRDTGLANFEEFNFNFRIHPLAAVWAEAIFEDELTKLIMWQAEWRDIVRRLAAAGLIVTSNHFFNSLPSRFRPTIVVADGVIEQDLLEAARDITPRPHFRPLAVVPAYCNKAFRLCARSAFLLDWGCNVGP
jgi:perosamine synthetase